MILSSHHIFKVEIIDDPTYRFGSADNRFRYDLQFQHSDDVAYDPVSRHGIFVYKHNLLYKCGLVVASGGGTGVLEGAALLHEDTLIIRCCNKLFSLNIPDLSLNWVVVADQATCFSVHQYEDDYITHGELFICRISSDGKILWEVGAKDIFVNIEHTGDTFEMQDDGIALMDWSGTRYKLNYDGEISETSVKPTPIGNIGKPGTNNKPWWKLW